jgi:hypothetical protein
MRAVQHSGRSCADSERETIRRDRSRDDENRSCRDCEAAWEVPIHHDRATATHMRIAR